MRKRLLRCCYLTCLLALPVSLRAQVIADSVSAVSPVAGDTDQRDLLDYVHQLFPRLNVRNDVSEEMPVGRIFAWILPSISYEPQTRLAANVGGNVAFRTKGANVSSILPVLAYTQNKQLIFHTTANIWLPGNRYNLTTDSRYLHYPQLTYGLGGATSTENALLLKYDYIRLYQTLSRRVASHTYVGGGYELDYHWNLQPQTSIGDPVPAPGYDLNSTARTVSSGLTLNFLYDERTNPINPRTGLFANVKLRGNFRFLGSDRTYPSLLIEVRKYINWPASTPNVLAIWSFNNLTLGGIPPYLDLPSTGWDANSNMGRGYIQGRFRGRNLLYAETEYRFRILNSGLLGGVVFGNVQSVSQPLEGGMSGLQPAGGAGLRLKLNKLSGVNLAVDYGIGADGSRSLYFNIGELF